MPQLSNQRVVLVGGAGYIGSVLTRRLLESGRQVTLFDRLDFGPAPIAGVLGHPALELVQADFRDSSRLRRAVEDADAVVHLAAIVGDAACKLNEEETLSVNRDGVRELAETCHRAGAARFVFASTCSVYGAADELVDESSPPNPVSLYARTKLQSERLLLEMDDPRFRPTALRLGTAFGWSFRPRFDLVVNLLTARAHFDGQAVIYNGSQWRPFIHVRDIARAFAAALDAPAAQVAGQVFNVGSNRMNRRLSDLGRALQARFPAARVLEQHTPDRRDYRVRFDKIEETLRFRATTGLHRGIAEMERALAAGRTDDYRAAEYHNHLIHRAAV